MIAAGAMLAVAYYGAKSGFVETWWNRALGSHGETYAERMAGLLSKTPQCAPYRAAILAYKGQSTSSDDVAGGIARAYEDGIAAGCKKSDLAN